jgi:HK97 family phage major capsid protein
MLEGPQGPISDRKSDMSKTETKAGGFNEPATEVKQALSGFLSDFRDFQADMKSRLQQQEERLTMMDRKSQMTAAGAAARPALSRAAEIEAPHQKAFAAYLRTGDDDGLRGLEIESKAMSSAVAGDGGYLVDPETAESIKSVLKSNASIRAIAQVVTVEATSYDVLVDHSDVGSGWASETATQVETDTPQIERVTIPLHELSAMPKASQRLLDDSAFDIEGWLAGRIADKFARAEAAAFVYGDGVDKPKGFLAHPIVAEADWDWGSIGYVATGADGDFDAISPADAILDLVYSLDAEYRANASFVMNSKTAGAVRKMKDADGRFLWSDGLSSGEPARLLGYPVLVAEDMPDIAPDTVAIAFGDFRAGYTVAERPDLRVLRDPFSAKPHVLFYATKRVGGDVSDFAAIKLLKFSVS